jgi:hypothetical protein
VRLQTVLVLSSQIVLCGATMAQDRSAPPKTGPILIQPTNHTGDDKDYQTLYITAMSLMYKLQLKARGCVRYLARPQ